MRILVVEDHAETRRMLERVLREAGHATEGAADLADARVRLSAGGFAAVVLDWMLPDGSGPDLCRELRGQGETTPVLMLTARGGVEDRVEGLDAGADDYLRKPFAVAELLARVRALLRRGPRLQAAVVTLGTIQVRLDERRVLREGRETPLTAREFAILEVLLRHRGRPVPRADILQAVWGEETESAASSLEVLIGRMRRKLAPRGGDGPIRTHRGFGYSIGPPG
ncbi:MAG TPA: response regulator transcription factor [Candidatus Polarisedimenticolia bacterium]|nr:response regulator transcription factor [Candidatus Polarisedimenticolia bacterium]